MFKNLTSVFVLSLVSACVSGCSIEKETWQGTYYPDWCLTCEKDYVYSPVFDNFQDCKTWALNQKSAVDDKMSCNKNCTNPDEYWLQSCEDVVRNWDIWFWISTTFDNYSE